MKEQATAAIGVIAFFVIGAIINIVSVIQQAIPAIDSGQVGELGGFFWAQLVTIFFGPVGSIMGYISLFV